MSSIWGSHWLIVVTLLTASEACAEERWSHLTAQHIDIWTAPNSEPARDTLAHTRLIQRFMSGLLGADLPPSLPLKLLIFRSESDFSPYKPPENPQAAGFYLPARDHDTIAVLDRGDHDTQVLFHEYVHLIVYRTGTRIPNWLNEGLSELVGSVSFRHGHAVIGERIPNRISALPPRQPIDLEALFTHGPGRNLSAADGWTQLYYAESWALVRLLVLSPDYRDGVSRFIDSLMEGKSHNETFQAVYGKSLDQVAQDLRASLPGNRLKPLALPFADGSNPGEPVHERLIDPKDLEFTLCGLLLDLGRVEEARQRLAKLAARSPESAELAALRGRLALAQGHPEEAVSLDARAIALGTRDPQVFLDRAMLLRDVQNQRDTVIADLRQALVLDPHLALAAEQLQAFLQRDEPQTINPLTRNQVWQQAKGDHSLAGLLVEVDCFSRLPLLVVIVKGERVVLQIDDPTAVELANSLGAATILSCGKISPQEVTIEYTARPHVELHSSIGTVTAIRFH